MANKHVLLISTTNLYSNPRLVKEINLFTTLEYNLSVISFKIGYGDDKSLAIEKNFPTVKFTSLSALKSPLYSWLYSSIISKLLSIINLIFKQSLFINAIAHNKRSLLINQFLKTNKKRYDLIIGHTLGSLYPAYKLAKSTNTSFSFDMEDYHPGELIRTKNSSAEVKRREFILKSLLPKAIYTTYASPLYAEVTNQLLATKLNNQYIIHNSFWENEFKLLENQSNKIQLIWYSLTITKARGLELILPLLKKHANHVHLTLIGNLDPVFDNEYQIRSSKHINFLGLLSQKELHYELCKADIGLSLEQKTTDLNRDLCITNKIMSYCQAGLYILATPTKAQEQLLKNNTDFGIISTDLEKDLIVIIKNIDLIKKQKTARFNLGKNYSWNKEQTKYKNLLKSV